MVGINVVDKTEGFREGKNDGTLLGRELGNLVGIDDGLSVGRTLGSDDGILLGT